VVKPGRRTDLRVVSQAARTAWAADPRGMAVAAAIQAVGALSALGLVLASKLTLDALLADGAEAERGLARGLGLLVLTSAASTSMTALQRQQQRLLGERVAQHVWRSLLASVSSVELIRWETSEFIDRLDRIRNNALARPTAVVTGLLSMAGSLLGVVSMAVALVLIHPVLVPVLLLAGIPAVWSSRRAGRLEFAFVRSSNPLASRRVYLKRLITSRESAAELRAFGAGPALERRHEEAESSYLAALCRHVRRRQVLALVSTGAGALALALTLGVIVVLVDSGGITLSEAGAAAIAARLLGNQLAAVFAGMGLLVESAPFLADMQHFLDEAPPAVHHPAPRHLTDAVVLDRVSFSYGGQSGDALTDVSIRVPAGSVVAVVGENGSGKTTMAKVLSGLYEPTAGKRCWDGDAGVPAEDVRASVTVLFQDFVRYQMTAAENITIAQADQPVDRSKVQAAADVVGISGALERLPEGLDTQLGKELGEGGDLSGGQWQRLALARALYRDAPVVVLDEPTAAMDPRAEHELFADVRRVLSGRTALLISHRYSSVRLADYIYVMAQGRVVEEGTHDQLMAGGGQYAELYTLQAAAYLR
jgi:ATP-binding cassette subfamily B protein